jgi:ferredoxin
LTAAKFVNSELMIRISRRKFIRKACLYNASLLFGTYWLSSCEKSYGSTSGLDYLPIQNSNPAIARWPKKCEECGDCTEVCREKQKVFGTYEASPSNHVCIHCGACIASCEEGALTLKYHWQDVLNAINNPSKIVIASVSPSVRVGIGDYFGMAEGSFLPENIVGACRA